MANIETDVLVVGSGPAGASAAALLSTYGIKNLLITQTRWLADTPRAHITNQRTMEVFRDLGIEDDAIAKSTPQELMGNNTFCTSLAGEELGRLFSWGNHPQRMADYTLASPTKICDLPQDLMEPIILGTAASRGSHVRFDTQYESHEQDEEGVTVTALDRLSGENLTIRAKYLIGADGARSHIIENLKLPMQGEMGLSGSINIVFEADLSQYVAHRPSVLYWVIQPGSDVGGLGIGVVRMVRPWNKWLVIWGYDIEQDAPDLTDEIASDIVHKLIGDNSIPVSIISTSNWTVNHQYAKQYSSGRVFCMGDAVHRHPPTNGLGSNTSIQDAYNLCWKMAYVLKGKAGSSLLNSYNAERAPVGKQIVERANKSIEDYAPIFNALGLLSAKGVVDDMLANIAKLKDVTPEAAEQREKLRNAILYKSYEYNCHGVELNQRYTSSAVVSDGTAEPAFSRDAELYYQATTWPGARLPHVWLGRGKDRISSLDLCGKGKFTLLTGITGGVWVDASKAVAEKFAIELQTYVIGPGAEIEDLYGDWAGIREISEAGCILVRPDVHVAWRHNDSADNAIDLLTSAFVQILGLQ